jgi:Fe2+ or Zn2+ uptake regulation protein
VTEEVTTDARTGGNRRPRDGRGLTPSRAAILDLVLAGVTEAPVIAAKRQASRQSIYQHLEHLISGGWVARANPNGNRTVAFQPTERARSADPGPKAAGA